MGLRTPLAETESPAETAPLLGPGLGDATSGSLNKTTSQGTFAGSSGDVGIGAADTENGSSHAGTDINGSSTDSAKPVKMAALFPALAIGVRARDIFYHGFFIVLQKGARLTHELYDSNIDLPRGARPDAHHRDLRQDRQ